MNKTELTIRSVKPKEASQLTQLAHLAKAYWGYSPEFLDSCAEDLTYRKADIKNSRYLFKVGIVGKKIHGFYALDFEIDTQNTVEMMALFVEPTAIGKGYGRRLFEHAVQTARDLGANSMLIHSDPYAEDFYLKMGATTIGDIESSCIEKRLLPLMSYAL